MKRPNYGFAAARAVLVIAALACVLCPTGVSAALRSPSGATCEQPTPFPAPDQRAVWTRSRSRLTAGLPGGPRHRAQDVVVVEGDPVRVVGKFAYGVLDDDLEGEHVVLYVHVDAPCGPWRQVATGRTTRDGERGSLWGVRDDGGRAFVEVPTAPRLPVGAHPARFVVLGDGSHADFHIYVVAEGTRAVVFDIDGTLTTGDGELFREAFGALVGRRHEPQMRPGARAAVAAWAARGYLPVYLTGRPDVFERPTKAWLASQGFPPGPLHMTDENRQSLPTEDGVARYKSRFLIGLRLDAGLRIVAAYGNAQTDITAYENAGVSKERTWIAGEHAGQRGTKAVVDYRICAEELKSLAPSEPAAPVGAW